LEGFQIEQVIKDKMKTQMVRVLAAGFFSLTIVFSVFGEDKANASGENDDIKEILKTLRSDVNATKIATLNRVLKLTAAEAEKFWPIYRAYEVELTALSENKVKVLRDFFEAQSKGKLDNITAADLSARWLAGVDARVALWKKYHTQISQALSPIRGAQFLQVENQMALFIDISIASEMPEIK
jgi:hypothetical protein